jgi:hypothetical protein
MEDLTENIRRALVNSINSDPLSKPELEALGQKSWTTDELTSEFEVLGFMAPFVVVRRLSDGVKGSMMFSHNPRLYFSFTEDK